jgi:drug/metabolite transporter (DMT)-like permease
LNTFITTYQGELFALLVAFFWAVSTSIYSLVGQRIHPIELNFWKCLTGGLMVGATLLIGQMPVGQVGAWPLFALTASGVIGIGVGDSLYLEALRCIGARRSTLLRTLTPAITGLLAWIFMGEVLRLQAWLGLFLILGGVSWVVTEGIADGTAEQNSQIWRGAVFGLLSCFTEASGVVLSRSALTSSSITPLWSTFMRIAAGFAAASLVMLVRRQAIGDWFKTKGALKLGAGVTLAIFIGSYVGIWLQQNALRQAPAGVVQTLISTTPLFVIGLAALMGRKISLRAVLGALVAFSGVVVIFR